uniref:Uncharacterized protein n=1 Tax=Anguilla anguilla TaxID=7936 RepID=A0A0E9RZD5_ANGAN
MDGWYCHAGDRRGASAEPTAPRRLGHMATALGSCPKQGKQGQIKKFLDP